MRLILPMLLFFLPAHVMAETLPIRSLVEEYTAAFNARDLSAMGKLMHPEIEWITVAGNSSKITTQGKEATLRDMEGYFSGPLKITSTLSGWGINGNFVSVVETASWTSKDGKPRSQSSNAVYQIEGGLVRRVWYFQEQ